MGPKKEHMQMAWSLEAMAASLPFFWQKVGHNCWFGTAGGVRFSVTA
jgi:hypothetical protein